MMMKSFARGLVVAACVVTMSACNSMSGGDDTRNDPPPNGILTAPPQGTPAPPEPTLPPAKGKQIESAKHPLLEVKPMSVTYSVDGGNLLILHYTSGDENCFGVEGFVEEAKDKVTVDFREGVYEKGRACTAIGRLLEAQLSLSEPLGDRPVVDAFGNPLEEETGKL